MLGFTRDVSKVATTPRTGQFACMSVGILIFFDDYASVLLAGETMRPLLDLLSVSREKLSFIVDATSAPIASVSFFDGFSTCNVSRVAPATHYSYVLFLISFPFLFLVLNLLAGYYYD